MKVWFSGETAQDALRLGVTLQPGENEVADDIGLQLVEAGLAEAAADEEEKS